MDPNGSARAAGVEFSCVRSSPQGGLRLEMSCILYSESPQHIAAKPQQLRAHLSIPRHYTFRKSFRREHVRKYIVTCEIRVQLPTATFLAHRSFLKSQIPLGIPHTVVLVLRSHRMRSVPETVGSTFTSEPCVLRMFGHDREFNTCVQSVPKKFRDGLHANEKPVKNRYSQTCAIRTVRGYRYIYRYCKSTVSHHDFHEVFPVPVVLCDVPLAPKPR